MSFEPPDGILDIGNATLRVGKLEVAETSGLNQGLLNIVKNNILINENIEYPSSNTWGIKLPTTWVAEFDVKGHSTTKYVEFNFYNEDKTSNALGYLLNFKDTTLSLMYDTSLSQDQNILATATIPTIVGAFRKVNIFFERGVISVSIDGTQYLYHKETDGFNQGLGVASRVVSTTGSAFVNLFIEETAANSKFKNLRIVNGRFISDKTSNIAFIGGNLGVGVNSPQEALDIRGNMHFNRVSNVSQVSVDSNVVTEYTGPHDRPLRKYPEVALTADAATASGYKGYIVNQSSFYEGSTDYAWKSFAGNQHWLSSGTAFDGGDDVFNDTNGPWISIQLPTKIKLEYLEFYTGSGRPGQTVAGGSVYASNDGSNWTNIGSLDNLGNYTDTAPAHVKFTHTTRYDRYLLHVTSVSLYTYAHIEKLSLYGHEEGSGSLDTTLKSVYNVPATTGTQLEVYYDAKDLAEMPSTVTDLSPNTNTGALSTSPPTLDTTDGIESFKFDASSSQRITSTIDTSYWGTNKLHSVSFWFKADTINGKFNIFHIGNPAASESSGFWISDGSADSNGGNSLNWWFYGGDSTLKTSSFSWALDTWYHIALTFDGSTKKLYVNGKHIDYSVGNVITTLPTGIPASASLAVGSTTNSGDYFDGSIANFRVYGAKVLNTGQVQELYDYQKDYFLGSKSQVTLYKGHLGVGVTEPSGQLELAGDERIQEYPPRAMTGWETYMEGHGVFRAGKSGHDDYLGAWDRWKVFNKGFTTSGGTAGDSYHGELSYSTSTGLYTGHVTSSQIERLGGILGDYFILDMPYKISLKHINLTSANQNRSPTEFIILGSNDGSTWTQIKSFSSSFTGSGQTLPFQVNSNEYFSYFGLVVTKVVASDGYLMLSEWQLFGTPGPTTLDKGSLTLGRSLDVPRISRYDVDTETPRPEKLVLDYDTTVKNDGRALDISGSGNDGFYYGHAYYSAPDKAFKFDGTGDTVYVDTNGNISDTNLPTGDAIYTMSCWIKANSAQYGSDAAVFYFGSGWTSYQLAGIYHGINGRINMDIGSYNMKTATGTIQSNRWYHVAIVKRGTGTLTSARSYGSIYIDGVEIDPANLTYNAGGPQALQSIDNISIGSNFNGVPGSFGEAFNGCISKPQIWNVALENSEINKLYRLGRTGRSMVISDTAVGIGKVPEAHLDVRGSLNVTGNFNGNSPLKFYRFRLNLPLNNTGTSYIRRNDGAAGFPSDYDDTKIISISSVVYNHNGDVVMGQGEDTAWKHSIYSIPLHSGSSNAGLVIYQKGSNTQSSSGGDRRLEILVVTY
jgi:hypothetical protein